MKLVIGFMLAICVGIGCRLFGIPLPGPPAILGAAMAVAMATGYTVTDYWMNKKLLAVNPSSNKNISLLQQNEPASPMSLNDAKE